MIRILFLVLVFLTACQQNDTLLATSPSSTQSANNNLHRPHPVVEPEVDETFMDPAAVEAWRADIAAAIEGDAAVPHPREIWSYVTDFHVDRSRPDPILGDPSIWDAAKVVESGYVIRRDAPMPRADEALALEAQDEEWAAAELWILMNRLDDAKRCSAELEKESEWKAVAMIAVHTGDLDVLDRATKRMIEADQVSRTKSVAQYAFSQGKIDAAKHIANAHGWRLSEILSEFRVRELAIKGDASILHELIDREIAAWEKNEFSDLPEAYEQIEPVIVADIAILGKTDKVKALEYAARYLKLPYANVLIWTYCGEGCVSDPIRGSLELYQLIAQDKDLRELYFARLRMAINEMYPVGLPTNLTEPWDVQAIIAGIEPGSYREWRAQYWQGWEYGNLFTSYLLRVRTMRDAELTAFWVAMLDTFPSRHNYDKHSLEFEREVGRCALGLSFKKDLGDPPVQSLILDVLSGGSVPSMAETWVVWDKELPSRGDLDWANSRFEFLTRGEVSPAREAAIRAELGIVQTPGSKQEPSLRSVIRDLFNLSLGAHYWVGTFQGNVNEVQQALERNMKARRLRDERGLPVIDLYPDTQEELDKLIAPSLALLCEKLPAKCQLWRPTAAPATEPVVSDATSAAASQAAVSSPEPTNCTFVNGNRPQIDKKYVITCDGGIFLANAEYKNGGVFAFSAFTPHTP